MQNLGSEQQTQNINDQSQAMMQNAPVQLQDPSQQQQTQQAQFTMYQQQQMAA